MDSILRNERTAVKQDLLLKALERHNGLLSPAAKEIGIHPSTAWKWAAKGDSKFKEKYAVLMSRIKECNVDVVERALFKQIDKGNVTAIIFYLKCHGRGRGYIEKQDVDVAGLLKNIKKMSDAELAAIAKS